MTHDQEDGARSGDLPPRLLPLEKLIGYEPVAPSETCREIDSAICAEASCEACGREGMEYHPFTRGVSYRAYAVCPVCGHAEEI